MISLPQHCVSDSMCRAVVECSSQGCWGAPGEIIDYHTSTLLKVCHRVTNIHTKWLPSQRSLYTIRCVKMNECAVGGQKILATPLFIGFSLPLFRIWISGPNWEPMRRLWSIAWDISACLVHWSVLSAFCLGLPLTDSLLLCPSYCPLSILHRDVEADELVFAT